MEIEYANCETPGCANGGAAIPFLRTAGVNVTCGACGQPVINVSETAPEPVTEVPEWLL